MFILSVVAVLVGLVLLFALVDLSLSRREGVKLGEVRKDRAIASAVSEILLARDNFSRVVSRYEIALAAQERVKSRSFDGGTPAVENRNVRPQIEADSFDHDVQRLQEEKAFARQRLLDAQRDWEMVRPGAGPAAASELWFGSGLMRAWQLGPVGFERLYYRFDHAIDTTCWVIYESRRVRFGFGLGAESQSLALFVVSASADQLADLSAKAFGGSEVAFRPGFVPMRSWRRIRRTPEVKAANRVLLGVNSVASLIEGPSNEARAVVMAAFEAELGEPITAKTVVPAGSGMMSVITKGPSVLVGAWLGSSPEPLRRASSDHGAWQQRV